MSHRKNQTPDNSGNEAKSELSSEEMRKVRAFEPDADTIQKAKNLLVKACNHVGLPAQDDNIIIQAAKILGALGEKRVPRAVEGGPHGLWLLTEAYINAGMDPASVHEAAIASVLGEIKMPGSDATRSIREKTAASAMSLESYSTVDPAEDSTAALEKKIAELLKKAVMPMPQKPADGATKEQIMEYRKALAGRHLKERLGKRHGSYSAGNMENLYEVLMTIVDTRDHEKMMKLYNAIAGKLTTSGAKVEGWLTRVSDEHFQIMIDLIAESGLGIFEETHKEKYLHAQSSPKSKDYVAMDLTTEYEIGDLYRELHERRDM